MLHPVESRCLLVILMTCRGGRTAGDTAGCRVRGGSPAARAQARPSAFRPFVADEGPRSAAEASEVRSATGAGFLRLGAAAPGSPPRSGAGLRDDGRGHEVGRVHAGVVATRRRPSWRSGRAERSRSRPSPKTYGRLWNRSARSCRVPRLPLSRRRCGSRSTASCGSDRTTLTG